MKIIKIGDPSRLKQIKRFTCKQCGCIFEAGKEEYNSGMQYNEIYYMCRCPTCGRTAYKGEGDGDDED